MRHVERAAIAWLLSAAAAGAAGTDVRLLDAVKHEDAAAVRTLVQKGVDVNRAQPDGATPLHWAAYLDDRAVADVLLRSGAKPNVANQLGVTPLMLACTNGSPAMVELLLKAGADPNAGPEGRENAVMTAARVGSTEVLQLLLARAGNANSAEGAHGQTALMWAAAGSHPDAVRVLLEHGANLRARTNPPPRRRGGARLPPVAPVAGREASAVAVVDAAPAQPAVSPLAPMTPPDGSNGFTPLLFAARVGDIESARALLRAGADVNDTAGDGMSALVLSTVRGYPAFAMFLLDQGANPNLDGAGYAALHWASGTWESELTVRAITTEREGEWSRMIGLKEGRLELVKALLAHGADPNARMKRAPARAGSSKNPGLPELEGATPVLLAAMAGNAAVMRALVAGGGDVQLRTKGNGTVLMAAAGLGHVQGEDLVRDGDALAAAQSALDLGVDPSAADEAGNTALHYAAYMRHDAVVQLLADRRVPLDERNKYGETPLWAAELVLQFMGGGTFQVVPSSGGALLRKLGAQAVKPSYSYARPTEWPDIPRAASDQVERPEGAPRTPSDRR